MRKFSMIRIEINTDNVEIFQGSAKQVVVRAPLTTPMEWLDFWEEVDELLDGDKE